MQTRSRTHALTSPRPPQSIAALLPAEIVDCIFFHLDFDYSIDASYADRKGCKPILSNMSVVTEGWKGPARRLLFRNVRIRSWEHLQEKVEDWAGGEASGLELEFWNWTANQYEVAKAVPQLLQKVPNLRQLRLDRLPFTSFSPAGSATMQTSLLLPHLSDLTITHCNSPKPFRNPSVPTSSRHPVIASAALKLRATHWIRSRRR